MAIVNEEPGGSILEVAPTQSMGIGDIYAGTLLSSGDTGDHIAIDLVAGRTYTLVLTGLGAMDVYDLFMDNNSTEYAAVQYDGQYVENGGLDSDLIWAEGRAGSGEIAMTFVADITGTYDIGAIRSEWGDDGDVAFTLQAFHGAIDLGSDGNDTVRSNASDQNVNLLDGDDSASGGRGNDTFDGGAGNDTVLGGNGDDSLSGGANDDRVHGKNGDDYVAGGAGSDRVFGGTGNDTVLGGGGDDRVYGNRADDSMDGGAGNDRLYGGEGDDTLNGGEDNDLLDGSFGNDVFAFGADSGNDTITHFQNDFDRIDVSALGITNIGGLTISQVGADAVIDFGGGNTVTLENESASDLVETDFIFASAGTPGTNNDDTMTGTNGIDFFDGLSGADSIEGEGGEDTLYGNDDNDTIRAGNDDDFVSGDRGNDALNGDNGNDTVNGSLGNDLVYGGADDDLIIGGAGKDTMQGGSGNDTVKGGEGIDLMSGGTGNDVFVFEENPGDDTIKDFDDGGDLIDLSALVDAGHITGYGDLSVQQVGPHLIINLYDNHDLTLNYTFYLEITASDFIF